MMQTLNFAKAQGTHPDRPVASLTLVFEEEMVSGQEVMWREGEQLASALWDVLPGGTVDALLASLMRRRAALLQVRFPEPPA